MVCVHEMLSRAHSRAYHNYVPRPYPGKTVLYRAKRQLGIRRDPTMGWREFFPAGLTVHEVPGYRQTMLREPNLTALGELLKASLAAAHAACGEKARKGISYQ